MLPNSPRIQETYAQRKTLYRNPEDRNEEDHRLHRVTVKRILSNEELNKMRGSLPSFRVVSYLVNGTPVEETQVLFRLDEACLSD